MNKKLSDSQAAKLAAAVTAALCLIVFGYRYLTLGFSGDAMLIDQSTQAAYQSSLGRFLQPVYWKIRGALSVPMTIGLFSTVFFSLSSALLTLLLNLNSPLTIFAVSVVVALNDTVCISASSYLPWLDVYALALLLALLGVYAFCRLPKGKLWCILFYALSMGLYQSYVQAGITIFIILLIVQLMDGAQVRQIWRDGIQMCLVLIASLFLYLILYLLSLNLFDIQINDDYNGPTRIDNDRTLSQMFFMLIDTYLYPLEFLFSPSSEIFIPPLLSILLGILLLFALLIMSYRMSVGSKLTLLFLLLTLPFGMNFVYFISSGLQHALMIYSFFFYFLLCVRIFESFGLFCSCAKGKVLSRAGSVFTILYLICSTITTQQMLLKHDLQYAANTYAFSRIFQTIDSTPGFSHEDTPVFFYGYPTFSLISSDRPGFDDISSILGMRYTYAVAYQAAVPWYIHQAMGYPYHLIDYEALTQTQRDAFAKMPLYPLEGCAQLVDGVLLFRMN